MRVAFLTHNACAGDAIGNQLAEKVRFFVDRAADTRVFLEDAKRLHSQIVPFARLVEDLTPDAEFWQYLRSCDLIFVEYAQYHSLLELLPLLAEARGRVVVDYHGVTPPRWRAGHNRDAVELGVRRRGLMGCADAVLCHSRFTRAEVLRTTRLHGELCHTLGYVVDKEHFGPGMPGESARERLGLQGATLLLFVGRVAPNKRLPVLVEALAQLRDRRPEVHALVAGDVGDLYQEEQERCVRLAEELGVANRLHFLGRVGDDVLLDLYRDSDVFVMPSVHEGFCLPVVEAMACGIPVVAARATALPETVADAGLTFEPDDGAGLARQIGRVLDAPTTPAPDPSKKLNVAVVAFRYGDGFAGGAEASLRTIASTLQGAGHHVSVWTTCNRAESDWANHFPEGTTFTDGIPVRRFRINPHARTRHLASLDEIGASISADKPLSADQEHAYIEHSIHSLALLDVLQEFDRTEGPLDGVIVGPYLFGLTYDIARAFGGRTLLVPCFHDEPLARLRVWRDLYTQAGGILYHSPEEQQFAQAELGLNHPGAVPLGTWLDTETAGDPEAGRHTAGFDRYIVYCGRYSEQKSVPELIEFAKRYQQDHPERFAFVFLGQGEVQTPREPSFRELGFVPEHEKRNVLAGAAALVQLSRRESLSITVLEAWSQGTPVLVSQGCSVLAGQVGRSQGGRTVADYEAFAAALDDLWERPEHWRELGRQGQEYARRTYGDRTRFLSSLEGAVFDLTVPLHERLRRRGRERAKNFSREEWRRHFSSVVDKVLEAEKRPHRHAVEVTPRICTRTARPGDSTLVPVRVQNRGTHPLACSGPARTVLRYCVTSESGTEIEGDGRPVSLPAVLLPGESIPASVRVAVPSTPGRYRLTFWAGRADYAPDQEATTDAGELALLVSPAERDGKEYAFLNEVRSELAELDGLGELPTDYLDVTAGFLAGWKRRVKAKLLNNFKRAYVDVLSRQQSACNRHLLRAVQELTEYVATLEHALSAVHERLKVLEARAAPRRKKRKHAGDGRRGG
jgi:glycosyltransferase involved in cell wall biosynthesis